MDQLEPVPVIRKIKIKAHWVIASLLLLLPLSFGLFCFLPQYYSFTTLGEIVPVREIGVNGSVHFIYVQEGLTRNRYEKYVARQAYPYAQFTRVDASAEDSLSDMKELGEDARNETIHNAVDSVAALSDEPSGNLEREELELALNEETEQYYGDSIGLMLSLGLYEEKQQVDFSRNGEFIIAGTGTMEEDHTVGSVGSIRDKLRTAENQGADIFLVPRDKETFQYEGISNEEEAQQAAQELHLQLQVVPVATLEEAITYLKQLH
ncbi:hypothetical protein [Paenibacillus sp. MMS18-CY102]|uniref:hypothetical protein n=1 Tax=Paenibacillus sp. MMS18-CY102 TaxID=2682849 RepID=UPI001366393C|nr:hypothetical protein [Paenibacillus sp. MMS18-CY102]MWC29636.1 hypothetical protein [Paenibacillus sp. MMS18-CY102]